MVDMPDVCGQEIAVGARYRFFLEIAFRGKKAGSKPLIGAF
jgi:hypothetical protein